ncbi:hypothetical protein TRIP_C20635 [Candidatus Zixiibacteriota bacterium]|nr:hypothetical protein TRIP_C20635 [candidate division Zixibacteria bacterium]
MFRFLILIFLIFIFPLSLCLANTTPIIGGPCGDVFETCGKIDIQFSAVDPDYGDTLIWSIFDITPSPPEGSITIGSKGLLTYQPAASDLGKEFHVTVNVTDRSGAFAPCHVTLRVPNDCCFEIEIQSPPMTLQGHHAYVPVVKKAGYGYIWGFDFLFGYDSHALSLMNIARGELFDTPGDYEWEYFTYRFVSTVGCSECPSGAIRVLAIANTNNGAHQPRNYAVNDNTTLFTLDFLVSNDRNLECEFIPIRFLWNDCDDNTIAYQNVLDQYQPIYSGCSRKVTDFDGTVITDNDTTFPTYSGIFDSCFAAASHPVKTRYVDFVDGGVEFACPIPIDVVGDVNLNGIKNEIGDAVLFTNYFVYGLPAFVINVEGQIKATDANRDGDCLRLEDLVYMTRIIVGDALPLGKFPRLAGDLDIFNFDGSISVNSPIGAFYAVFDGDVDITLGADAANMQMKTGFHDGQTFVLIYSFEPEQYCLGEILETPGQLIYAEAATYWGSKYQMNLLPTNFRVRNYPNPFNSSVVIEMFLPEACEWSIDIYNTQGQKTAAFGGNDPAGYKKVIWQPSGEASGIYFYKVRAGRFGATKKMVLLK